MKTKTNYFNILLLGIIILTPLLIPLFENHQNPDNCIITTIFSSHEDAQSFVKKPEVNDLYVMRNQESQETSYFKIVGENSTSTSFIILDGKNILNNSGHTLEIQNLLQSTSGFSTTVNFLSKEELKELATQKEISLEIHRTYKKPPFVFWQFYNTPIGYFFYFLFIASILAILNLLSRNYIKNKLFFERKELVIYLSLLITCCYFFKAFNAIVLIFLLLSIIPITFIFHRINNAVFYKQKFTSREIQRFALIYSGGFTLQIISFLALNHFYQTPHYNSFYEMANNSFYYAEQLGFLSMLNTFLLGWLILAISNFLNNLRKHFIQLRQKEKQLVASKQKELQSQAELDALQARVNPHFLYNSLNSIAGLAQEDPAKTEEMAIALSHFFKYSTNRQTENWSTVEKEIEILETYLKIEKIRFGERLQFVLNCPEELWTIKMPRFLLQPLVENAIKYGYNKATNSINIKLVISQENLQLHFQLFDGGMPFPDDMPSGYGVQSIRKKLALLYPEKHELAFINEPKKHVTIQLTR